MTQYVMGIGKKWLKLQLFVELVKLQNRTGIKGFRTKKREREKHFNRWVTTLTNSIIFELILNPL